jgi:hypothetical protein
MIRAHGTRIGRSCIPLLGRPCPRATNYTGTGIDHPNGITAGPDGALWFTSPGNNSIGRITTAMTPVVTSLASPRPQVRPWPR